MSKKYLLIWLTSIFVLFLALAIYTFNKNSPLFLLGSEFIIIFLYVITIWLILRSLQPISFIGRSLSLLKEGVFNITMVKTGNKDVDNIIDVYNSMISRLREERLLVREKNHFLDLLIESSPLGIVIVDLDEKITDVNKAALKCLNIEQNKIKGNYLRNLKSKFANELEKVQYEEKQLIALSDGEKYLCRKLYFMDHGFKHPFYIIEEFTEELRIAEKKAYGKLIRMMAHEVNNTIGSVNSIMTTLQSDPGSFVKSERDDIVKVLGVAIQRNYQLNKFMQTLSNVIKLPAPVRELMDLNESLMVVTESFGTICKKKKISLTTNMADISPKILADRSQMEQVFSNILKNSIEAVDDEGHISVSVNVNPVFIRFEDNGSGLSKEAYEHLFTPFFSTKPGGQGIGLTIVQEILTNHGFSFSFYNNKSRGTEFIIRC